MFVLRNLGLLLLGMLIGVAPAAAQSNSRVGSGLTARQILKKHGLERAWWAQAVMNFQRDTLTHITNDERNVYVQSSNGVLTAFDAESGRQKWYQRVGNSDNPTMEASSDEKHVYVWSRANLYVLDKNDGKILMEIDLPDQPSTSARADSEGLYLGFLDGSVYKFDPENGRLVWRYKTSKRILVPPLPNGDNVLFASTNGILYNVNSLTRDHIYLFETDNQLTAPLARYQDLVLLASEDFKLYAVNIKNGSEGWKHPFLSGDKIRKAPIVIGDNVYLTPEHRGLFRLDAATGVEHWFADGIDKVVAINPKYVYGVDRLNHLVKISQDTGEIEGRFALGPLLYHMTNALTDRIYLARKDGLVVCLRETDREFPHYHQRPDEQPLLPQFAPEAPAAAAAGQ